jgi:hypothetical protein
MELINEKYARITSSVLVDNVTGAPAVWTGMDFRRSDNVSLEHPSSAHSIKFEPEYSGFIDTHTSGGGEITVNPQSIWEYSNRTITGYTNPSNRKSVNDKLDDFLQGTQ